MEDGENAFGSDDTQVLDQWTARKVQPVVLLYVVLVFVGFMALALFVFHSREAVTALAMAAVAAVFATVPGVLERVEYRATEAGLEKRAVRKQQPGEFEGLVRWDELDQVVPLKHGFKFFKPIEETSPFRRFWKKHVSDRYSGEVHVATADLERVLGLVEMRRPRGSAYGSEDAP
jgi:hypothetical protein